MKLAEIVTYTELVSIKPAKHTTKLHHIIVLGKYTNWNPFTRRNYTYFTYKTKEGTFYPSSNNMGLLDGMVGSINLSDLKREYKIVK